MSSGLTPEERRRIEEEQKIRDKTQMKTAFKYLGITLLIMVALAICGIVTGLGFINNMIGGG